MFAKQKLNLKSLFYSAPLLFIAIIAAHQSTTSIVWLSFTTLIDPQIQSILLWVLSTLSALVLIQASSHAFHQALDSDRRPGLPCVGSWVPFIGNGFSCALSLPSFLHACHQHYGRSFKFLSFGKYIVVTSSPTAIHSILNDRSGVFDVFEFQRVNIIAGISVRDRDHLAYLYSVAQGKAFPAARQAISPRHISPLIQSIGHHLYDQLDGLTGAQKRIRLPLRSFIKRTMYYGSAFSLLGPHFPKESLQHFVDFEKGFAPIMLQMPFLAPGAVQAREKMVGLLSNHLETQWRETQGGYLEGASEAISLIYRQMRNSEYTHDEIARLINAFMWTAQDNLVHVTFWVMAYILTSKETASRIREELQTAFDDKFGDINAIINMDPHLLDGPDFAMTTSAVKEALRLTLLSVSFREALQDTELLGEDGEVIPIEKGDLVLPDVRGMHMDESIHKCANDFEADRFAPDSLEDQKVKEKNLMLFGGGSHMCIGRYFTLHTVRMYIILLHHLFDMTAVEMVGGGAPRLPKVNDTSVLTLFHPTEDIDVLLRRRE